MTDPTITDADAPRPLPSGGKPASGPGRLPGRRTRRSQGRGRSPVRGGGRHPHAHPRPDAAPSVARGRPLQDLVRHRRHPGAGREASTPGRARRRRGDRRRVGLRQPARQTPGAPGPAGPGGGPGDGGPACPDAHVGLVPVRAHGVGGRVRHRRRCGPAARRGAARGTGERRRLLPHPHGRALSGRRGHAARSSVSRAPRRRWPRQRPLRRRGPRRS